MSCGEDNYQKVLRRIRALPMSWYKAEDIKELWKHYEEFANDEKLDEMQMRGHEIYSNYVVGRRFIKKAIQQCEREAQEHSQPSMHSRTTPPSSPLSRLQLSSHTLDILQELHSRIEALEAYL